MSVLMHSETAVGELKSGTYAFPLQAVDVRGTVRGLLYSASVTQVFRNEKDTRMEAVYIFPLPPKAAVHGFVLKVGDRVIEGEIKERGAARREYQQAVQQGHRAALMEEERSDIFTTTVGNIGPGETVEIKFELSGPLSCFKNTSRLRLPLVVGEVYIPGKALAGDSVGAGTETDTDQVPDASRITPPRLADGAPNPVALSVCFEVEPSGLTLTDVNSTCHFARTKSYHDGRYRVSLLPGVERMDKAFVLEVTYPENQLQTSLLVDEKNKAFCLTVVPPAARETQKAPRDVVILLDRSGSMQGWSMIAARRAAARIIESLGQEDRFGLICFDDRNEHFDHKQGLCHANNFYKMRAAEYLSKIESRGGTQALPALQKGLEYFRTAENRDPHIILITDGDVGNDSAIIRSCQTGIRISTVGIGYAAREGLLNRMAEVSGGLCSLIPNQADLEKDLVEMHRKWGQPVWKGLALSGADEKFKSPKFWDVWQDVPTTFFGRLDERTIGEVTSLAEVRGWFQGKGQFSQELQPIVTEDPVVYRSWARSRLLDLEDLFLVSKAAPAELVALSVSAKVLCRFTAFTAIDKTEKVDIETELAQAVQPVEQTIQKKRNQLGMSRSSKRPSLRSGSALGNGRPMLSGPAKPSLRSRSGSPLNKPTLGRRDSQVPGSPPRPPSPAPADQSVFSEHFMELACEAPKAEVADSLFDCAPDVDLFSGDDGGGGFFGDDSAEPVCEALEEGGMFDDVCEDAELESFDSLFEMTLPDEAKTAVTPDPMAKATNDALEQQITDFLRQDKFLELGSEPTVAEIEECLELVKKVIAQLTQAIRAGNLIPEKDGFWKQLLSELLDYQEALEDTRRGPNYVRLAAHRREKLSSLWRRR